MFTFALNVFMNLIIMLFLNMNHCSFPRKILNLKILSLWIILCLLSACRKDSAVGTYRVRISTEGLANKIYGLKIRYKNELSNDVELFLDDSINKSLSTYTTSPIKTNGKLFVAGCVYRGVVEGEMSIKIEILKGLSGETVVARFKEKVEKGTVGRSFGRGLSYFGAYLAAYVRIPAKNFKGYSSGIMPAQEYIFPQANTFNAYDK